MNNLRDHLANERTFLAWIRTSIGLMAFGFVVEKFSLFLKQITFFIHPIHFKASSQSVFFSPRYSVSLGIILVLMGTLLCLFSFIKYKKIDKQIEDLSYRPTTFLDTILALTVFLIGIFLVIYLVSSI